MLRVRATPIIAAAAFVVATACQHRSLSDMIVGVWEFDSIDNTIDYVFKADHTFEMWAPPMDPNYNGGRWLQVDFGSWDVQGDELALEYKRPRAQWAVEFNKSQGINLPRITRERVLRFRADKIEFQKGGPFIRLPSRQGI